MSGASADKILGHPIVVRVAGDRHAGFYRPRPGTGAAGGASPGIAVEAYRWGALTAGAAVRTASMLLLVPFMLSNLAIWLRPRSDDRFGLLGALCRLLAGSLTAALMLAIIGVTVNLVGWQCVPYAECRADRAYLSWLVALPMGPRLALLSLIPLLALRLFWSIGARSARTFEGFGPTSPEPEPSEMTESLTTPGFWDDERITAWLRQIHVGIGAGTVDVSLLAGVSPGRSLIGPLLLDAAAALVAFCAVLLCLPVPASSAQARRLLRPLWVTVAVVTCLSLGYAAATPATEPVVGQLPGYQGSTGGLVATQGVLLVAIAVVTFRRQKTNPTGNRPFLRGLGTPVVAAMSVSVAAAFTATLVFRVADHLDRGHIPDPVRPNPPSYGPLEPPVAYWWAAIAGLIALLLVAAAAAATLVLTRRRRRTLAERVVGQDYPNVPADAAARAHLVREIITRSQVTDELGPMLVVFFVVSALGLATVALDLLGIGPTQLATRLSGQHDQIGVVAAYTTDIGIWVISLLVVALLLLGYRAYRSHETRRLVAVLWDLGTFWPRTVHPFAPPCYAARAVPELTKRVAALAARGPVVISGHSHGSVLAAATILQLSPAALPSVALLTHGCPLRRIYARLYPAYLGDRTLCELGDRLDWRWRNLWRDTDPIGGPLFGRHRGAQPSCDNPAAGSVDVRLRDPRAITIDPADTVPPPVERHWPYHTQPQYQAAVRELADRAGRAGTTDPVAGPEPPT
ncbi:hypothetical protein GA0074695_3253 [Micromonospora viridifaciens]|uniref:Integral membrane protein n=1 Tax=Micromonospora viridifaciens TaxID=1881 RepID=A0A1C4XF45_MICVI|nr:hypothetical protein GA0074695_3253 [Micromonospora viridifaciens]